MRVNQRLLRWSFTTAIMVAIVIVGYLEFEHHYNYGHWFSYGVHVDVVNKLSYIGIPGQTHMYQARISNFTFLPVKFAACEYMTDTLGTEIDYPHSIQRWDENSNDWVTVMPFRANEYCRPEITSRLETGMIEKWIWPGMLRDVSDWEATGARAPFRQGDLARFVVFRNLGTEDDWKYAIPSDPFVIADQVIRDVDSGKITH